MKVSFAVHSYNEADALRRLVMSSLPLASLFQEWIIVDHRSTDHTQDVISDLLPKLNAKGISLKTLRDDRDLSAAFTFADIRNKAIKAASHPIVVIHDADFILGPKYALLLTRAVNALSEHGSPYYAGAYTVPCVWDNLKIAGNGMVVSHGRVWVHNIKPRILWRDAMHYAQIGQRGRWERPVLDDPKRQKRLDMTGRRHDPLYRDTLVACNVKTPERIALRDTMTMFMQDAMQGKAIGGWLENYEAGKARSQGAYDYQKCSLRGWKLYAPGLDIST